MFLSSSKFGRCNRATPPKPSDAWRHDGVGGKKEIGRTTFVSNLSTFYRKRSFPTRSNIESWRLSEELADLPSIKAKRVKTIANELVATGALGCPRNARSEVSAIMTLPGKQYPTELRGWGLLLRAILDGIHLQEVCVYARSPIL